MKPIQTALLSFGMSGRVFHAPFIHLHSGFQLVGSWERSKQIIKDYYPGVKSFSSFEEILNDEQIELVVINTPTYTHYEYTRKVLESGKHAIVEKAFVGSTEEAEELRDIAKAKGLKLSVFQNRRFDSDFKTVKRLLATGQLGDIIEARIAFDRWRPELSPKAHKEKPSSGAGIIKDLGAHVIDQAIALFGAPESVFADIGMTREGTEVDDYFDILLKYEKNRVHVHGGYFFKEQLPGFIIYGTNGSFLKSRADVQEDQLQAGMTPDNEAYGLEPADEKGVLHIDTRRGSIPTEKGNYMDFYEGVYQSIRTDSLEPVTAADGVLVMRVIDAAFESHEKGIAVKL
jgi:scyllo-inositol 2-dehydrogenase (NADP+)